MIFLFVGFFLLSSQSFGATITWDFSDTTELNQSSLVYNQVEGVLHPTLQVTSYNGAAAPLDFSVGDGSDGAFNINTYVNFDSDGDVSGNEIVIDADQFPVLNSTQFHLAQGWTLKSINGPLVILSLGSVTIEGTIDCDGENGGDGVGVNAGVGGTGYCGGGNGGDGGTLNNSGQNGDDIDSNVTGGRGGNTGGAAVSGGGGGSWHTGAGNISTDGTNASIAGGRAGDMLSDPTFSNRGGGAGGGGGSGTGTEAGAGGGAGGGQVVIQAVGDVTIGSSTNNSVGFILASGGDGGDSNVPGGAGGGGGGGSISVYSAGLVTIFNTNGAGASIANKGNGGSNLSGHNGGNGGLGRSFFPTQNFNFVGFYTPAEQAPINTGTATVTYSSDSQSAESIVYDLQNTRVSVNSLVATPASSDFTLELAGSDDNFFSDDTGFTTDLSLLESKRYIKIRATIATTNTSDPDKMDSIVVNFSPGNAEEFDFTTTSCGMVKPPKPDNRIWIFLLLPLAMAFSLKSKKRFL